SRNLDAPVAARFRREAHAIAQLQHPNILPIYDYGEQDGFHYFVVQYIQSGVTLQSRLEEGPIALLDALRVLAHVLDGLQYAHDRGVIHRDIKPSNILMLRPDWPLVADFGIAKLIDESQELTPADQAIGTAAYMAPERAKVGPVDARSDLYSAGVVLYEMTTGRVPFDAATPLAVLMKHIYDPLPPPRSIKPDLPVVVEQVLSRALAKEPEDRYQSAGEMAAEIRRASVQIERDQVLAQLMSERVTPIVVDPYRTDKLPDSGKHAAATVRVPPSPPEERRRPPGIERMLVDAEPEPGPQGSRLGAIVAVSLLALVGGLIAMVALSTLSGFAARGASPATAELPAATAIAIVESPLPTAEPPTLSAPTAEPPTLELPTLAPTSEPPTPEPTLEPTIEPATPEPTAFALPTPVPIAATPVVVQAEPGADGRVFVLDDTAWQGGYRSTSGSYGGRTATWIYGTSTEYSSMRAVFDAPSQPRGTATLSIEGMDSEDRLKTQIGISVNGVEIYRGP
ncbi:MAG TPA: protein kinase, partial [Roseiflexaceae bacterium]|nr:protein kinase [Roseiflexaceae bacterium]